MARKFDDFVAAVKDSVENHARRKNYTAGGADDQNQMLTITRLLGINNEHGISEIIYKCGEYLKAPAKTRKVLLEKIAGWAWCLWRELPEDQV